LYYLRRFLFLKTVTYQTFDTPMDLSLSLVAEFSIAGAGE